MRALLWSILFWMLVGPLWADELLPKVQRELVTQKFYFGEIDGRASDETVAAIKKFQEAKGIDKTGQLDDDTLRSLGIPDMGNKGRETASVLADCNLCVVHYWAAWESGKWEREAAFYTEKVNYYYERDVSVEFIRAVRAKENRQWPRRKSTVLNRIASLEPGQDGLAQVTARVRMEVGEATGPAHVRMEDLIFRLQKTAQGWRIAALKLLE